MTYKEFTVQYSLSSLSELDLMNIAYTAKIKKILNILSTHKSSCVRYYAGLGKKHLLTE